MNNLNKDELAEMVSQLLWRKLVVPALSIQFVFGFLCLVSQPMLASRCWSADRADEEISVAAPDPGEPPAPSSAAAKKNASIQDSDEASAAGASLAKADAAKANATEASAAEVNATEASAAEVSAAVELLPLEPTPAAEGAQPVGVSPLTESGGNVDSRPGKDKEGDRFDSPQSPSVRQLSVPPESQMLLPDERPAWVGAPPDLSTSNHRLFVGSFPCTTPDETEAALDEPMVAAVEGYLNEMATSGHGGYDLDQTYGYRLSAEFIRKNLLDSSTEFMAKLSTKEGPLYQKWVVLKITPEHREHFARSIGQLRQQDRIKKLAVGLVGVLTLTGLAHVAFNLRRRRYPNSLPPATHALLPNEPAGRAKRKHGASRWLIGAGLLAALWVGGAMTLVPSHRSVRATVVTAEPYPPEPMADVESRIERTTSGHRPRISIDRPHQVVEVTSDRH